MPDGSAALRSPELALDLIEPSLSPELRREAQRAHPLVRKLFYALIDGCLADAVLVYRRTIVVNRAEFDIEGQSRAVEALREAFRDTTSRSSREYVKFFEAQRLPHAWPSFDQVCRAFGGSWSAAVTAAFPNPAQDVGSRDLISQGRRYPSEGLLDSVRAWASEEREILAFPNYLSSCARLREQGNPAGLVLPESGTPFDRFGGWIATLDRLDLGQRRFKSVAQLEAERERDLSGLDWRPLDGADETIIAWVACLNSTGHGVRGLYHSDEELIAAVSLAARSVGPTLSEYDYDSWARWAITGACGAQLRRLPSAGVSRPGFQRRPG